EDSKHLFNEVRNIAQQSDKILAKELRADELGIIYTTIAGYNSQAIVQGKSNDSFFSDWSKSRHPLRYTGSKIAKTHPNIDQRTTAVKVRLQQISEHSDLFRIGLWFYYSGDYIKAIQSFDEFRRHFPGRAVHHNLASSYHRLAMRFYNAANNKSQQLQFQLAMTIDPESRASNATIRNISGNKKQFNEAMSKAVKYYKLALDQDPSYIQSNINLASAYFHTGQPYKTIATSLDGLKASPNNHLLLNNLAVALYETGNLNRARNTLNMILRLKPDFLPALYNIGNIELREGNHEAAESYWQKYLDKTPETLWAKYLLNRSQLSLSYRPVPSPKNTREHIINLQVGTYTNELPESWQQKYSRKLNISESPFQVTEYSNDVTTVAESDEIRLIIANSRFKGKTQQGISIGNTKSSVFNRYGYPAYTYMAASGQIIAYPEHGISFRIVDDMVSSWLLYWE
ncbi:MAG: tetratricopeptide repeat protein, partial [Gammaproteobacteria bacterium]|nr:tetratricopeptide repeat protein [Gammaproteobacteria bacterium]